MSSRTKRSARQEAGREKRRRRRMAKAANKGQYFDYNLLVVIIFLVCFGLVMLYSTSSYEAHMDFGDSMYYFTKQGIISVLSFVVMVVVSKIDYHLYGPFSFELYIFAMFMMALVQTPLGIEIYGARRWIQLPGNMTLQPSEIAKIAIILFMPYLLCKMGRAAYDIKGMVKVFSYGLVASGGVLFLTDNLSTAIIVMSITVVLIFVVHPKTKPFLLAVSAIFVVVMAGVLVLSATITTSENFRLRRILAWLKPEEYAAEGGYQVMQGLYAIGSGGFFGKGLGNSTQKLGVIPEVQNDMILSIVCEELGVFGAIVILILFGLLLYRLLFIAQNAPDMYGSLIATGIFIHIALQVILNIMVVLSIIPTTGITLPFISYGGTSVLFLLTEMGIALGISRKIKISDE